MKLLVSLSSYGNKNLHYLEKVVDNFLSFKKYDVTVQVHCTVPISRTDIIQTVHDSPETTALFHRQDFIREKSNYDLFLFAEYDMLITENVVDNYLHYSKNLPLEYCPGFIRYENTPEGTKYLIDLWLTYSYIEENILTIQEIDYFTLTNVHQASYLLTREKLKYLISTTEFNFTTLNGLGVETASSGIFTDWPFGPQGKLKKVVPKNKHAIENSLIHHMADCHCNLPGVNSSPEVFRQSTVTLEKLLNDLDL